MERSENGRKSIFEIQWTEPLIHRPFFIFNNNKDIVEIGIKVDGSGTVLLSNAEAGEIDRLGPVFDRKDN